MRNPEAKVSSAPASASAPMPARLRFPVWLIAALLALATIALYWPALSCDFVNYDDPAYVTENPHVQGGINWERVKWAFSNPVLANWHPLTVLSHMLDFQLYGLQPWGHHLTSVLLHAVNTVLVFLLLWRMTGFRPDKGVGATAPQAGALWRSALVAALFGWHPLHVESVAWVAERKDVLSACFGLFSLLFYTRYAQNKETLNSQPSTLNYTLALLFFALGLMSKAMLVTWPFVMLLLDYWPLGRVTGDGWRMTRFRIPVPQVSTFNHLLFEKLPFFGLAAAMSIATFVVQKETGALTAIESLPLGARSGNALISYCRYLGKLLWPADLAVCYPHPGYWPAEQVVLAGGFILGITVLFIVERRRYPFLLMGWLWFVGTLVPVIQLVQTGSHAMADRYTYIPSLGVLILAIWGAYELTCHWRYHDMALSVAACAAIILCFGLTRQQLGYWKNSETLFWHALAVTENNYLAHNNLGIALGRKGQIDQAISQYQEAIRVKPDSAEAYNNLGIAFNKKGRIDEAIKHYHKALEFKPDFVEAHNNLGMALAKQGRAAEAIEQYQKAIELNPDRAELYNNLGSLLTTQGETAEAVQQFQKALAIKPDYAKAHDNLANIFTAQGRWDEAIEQYQQILKQMPGSVHAHYQLGVLLQSRGEFAPAIAQFQNVLELDPQHAMAHNNLAWLLATCPDNSLRDGKKAVALAKRADQLSGGNHPELLDTLAAAYAEAGQFDKAVPTAKQALDLAARQNNHPLAEAIQTHLSLYEANSPYHEKP